MMQHRRGAFFTFDGKPVEVRDFALAKMENRQRLLDIRITQIAMASRRIIDDYPELAAWFCLRVMAGREFLVEDELKKMDVEALVPTYQGSETRRRGRLIEAPILPVLPGYVLVRCVPSAAAMAGLRRFEKVLDVVGSAETPYRVPEKYINKFIEKAKGGRYDRRPPAPVAYEVGEPVRVMDGPFASFPGTVVSWDGPTNRVKVEVMIFGRETPIELDVAQIEKV
jgi:transcription termination/antitermination protein NusG